MVGWLSAHSQPFSPFQTFLPLQLLVSRVIVWRYCFILSTSVPLFLKVLPAWLQMLSSKLKEDMDLGVGVGILGRKVNLAALTEVDGEWGRVNGHLSETCSLTT